jgi:Ca2+-binding EF-hand superfamily protein
MLGLADAGLHEFTNSVEDAAATLVRSAQEIASAIQTNEDRLFNAIHRSDSLADQLARFDLQAQREREAEIAAGGQALASLEAAIQQERLNLINDFLQQQLDAQQQANDQSAQEAERVRQEQIQAAQQAAEERARAMQEAVDFIQGQVRNIQEWVNNFLAGQQSILPPSQQMATARAHFASEYALAQSGNRDALSNITNSAQQVVDSVRRYFGSSTAGQTIIQQLLGSLGTLPSLLSPEEFIVENLTPPIDNVSTTVTTTTSTQTATLAALLNNLRLAVQANDPQAIAIALLPLFDGIDTSGDQALSFNELVAALGSTFSTGTLQSIFQELDTNGDQLLQKSELIRQAAQSTAVEVTPVGDIENNTDAAKNLLQTTADRIAQGTAETSLWLSQIWNTLVTTIHNDLQQMISWLGWLGVIAGWAPGSSHAAGGYITGGIPGRDSVHAMLTPGEFVVRQPVARMYPWLENFNATGMLPGVMSMGAAANDNSVVVALSRLERSLLRGFKAMIETQLQAAGIVAEPMREANKLTRTRRGEKKVA